MFCENTDVNLSIRNGKERILDQFLRKLRTTGSVERPLGRGHFELKITSPQSQLELCDVQCDAVMT